MPSGHRVIDDDGSAARTALLFLALGVAIEGYARALTEGLTMELESAILPPGGAGALLGHLGLFGISLVGRLLGAPVVGVLSDRWGEAHMAQLSVAVLGTSLLLLGVLPGYSRAGIISRVGFGALWFLQNAAVSGQLVISSLLAIDLSPQRWRGLTSGVMLGSAAFGSLSGSAVVFALRNALGSAALARGSWRIPFIVGSALCASIFGGQRWALPHKARGPKTAWPRRTAQIDHKVRRNIFVGVVLISSAWAAPSAVTCRWLPQFLSEQAGVASTMESVLRTTVLGLLALLMPIAGHCASSKGNVAVLVCGQGSLLLWPPLLWCASRQHILASSVACCTFFAASLSCLGAPLLWWLWDFAPILGGRCRLVVAWASAEVLAGPVVRAAALVATPGHVGPFAAGLLCAAFGMAGLRSLLAGWRKVVAQRELEAWRDDALGGDVGPPAIVFGHRDEEVSDDIEAELEEELVELSHGLKFGGSEALARRWGGSTSGTVSGDVADENEELPLFAGRQFDNGRHVTAGDTGPAGL